MVSTLTINKTTDVNTTTKAISTSLYSNRTAKSMISTSTLFNTTDASINVTNAGTNFKDIITMIYNNNKTVAVPTIATVGTADYVGASNYTPSSDSHSYTYETTGNYHPPKSNKIMIGTFCICYYFFL